MEAWYPTTCQPQACLFKVIYSKASCHRMSFHSGHIMDQKHQKCKNRKQLNVLKELYPWEQIKGKPLKTDVFMSFPIYSMLLITSTVVTGNQKLISRQTISQELQHGSFFPRWVLLHVYKAWIWLCYLHLFNLSIRLLQFSQMDVRTSELIALCCL